VDKEGTSVKVLLDGLNKRRSAMMVKMNSTVHVNNVRLVMKSSIEVKKGDRLIFPFSIEVKCAEPSEWQNFHNKYAGQECTVLDISVCENMLPDFRVRDVRFLVKFDDGVERNISSNSLVALCTDS